MHSNVFRVGDNPQYDTPPGQPGASQQGSYTHNPKFPNLPDSTPLTVVLTMAACLSDDPAERPTFLEVSQILNDVRTEVRSGAYINSNAQPQVCTHISFVLLSLDCVCLCICIAPEAVRVHSLATLCRLFY